MRPTATLAVAYVMINLTLSRLCDAGRRYEGCVSEKKAFLCQLYRQTVLRKSVRLTDASTRFPLKTNHTASEKRRFILKPHRGMPRPNVTVE
jgi:hypothetical protein